MEGAKLLDIIRGLHSSQISAKINVEPYCGEGNVSEFIRKYEDLTRTLEGAQSLTTCRKLQEGGMKGSSETRSPRGIP